MPVAAAPGRVLSGSAAPRRREAAPRRAAPNRLDAEPPMGLPWPERQREPASTTEAPVNRDPGDAALAMAAAPDAPPARTVTAVPAARALAPLRDAGSGSGPPRKPAGRRSVPLAPSAPLRDDTVRSSGFARAPVVTGGAGERRVSDADTSRPGRALRLGAVPQPGGPSPPDLAALSLEALATRSVSRDADCGMAARTASLALRCRGPRPALQLMSAAPPKQESAPQAQRAQACDCPAQL